MDFSFYPLRFCFRAQGPIYFPPGKAANVLRGGFGLMLKAHAPKEVYNRIFEPSSVAGPSGFKDPPRPFVFRASHLDGQGFAPGESFHFDVNLFDTRRSWSAAAMQQAFQALGEAGFGPGRGKAELKKLEEPVLVTLPLLAAGPEVSAVRVDFVTPLELKSQGEVTDNLEFEILFSRIRDRVSTLRCLYGAGPLDIDFKETALRASQVRRTGGKLTSIACKRRSSRTGQTYEIGGLTGWTEYAGELREFLPYLRAAEFCGVGRQCVWGKGQIRVVQSQEM
jgi:hypothetical protein